MKQAEMNKPSELRPRIIAMRNKAAIPAKDWPEAAAELRDEQLDARHHQPTTQEVNDGPV